MSNPALSPSLLWKQLGKIIDLPPKCRKLVITLEVGRIPVIDAQCLVTEAREIKRVTRRFEIRERPTEGPSKEGAR